MKNAGKHGNISDLKKYSYNEHLALKIKKKMNFNTLNTRVRKTCDVFR